MFLNWKCSTTLVLSGEFQELNWLRPKILMLTRIFNFKNHIVWPQQFQGVKWWFNLGINYWNFKEINSMNIKELGIQWRTSNCWCWDYYSESNHEQYGRWGDKFSGHVRKFLRTIAFQEKRTLWNFSTSIVGWGDFVGATI